MIKRDPSPNGGNGRDPETGRFLPGWKGGPGNPYGRRVADIRRVLVEAVTDEDLYDLARTLVEKGKAGDVMAAREVFDRLMGKPKATLSIEDEHMTGEEAEIQIRAMVQNPELAAMIREMMDEPLLIGDG